MSRCSDWNAAATRSISACACASDVNREFRRAVFDLLRRKGHRHPHRGRLAGAGGRKWEIEAARHDADDRVGLLVEADDLAHGPRAGTEPALPQLVAEEGHAGPARLVFRRGERPTGQGRDAERGKERVRHPLGLDADGFAVAREVHRHRLVPRDGREGRGAVAIVEVFGGGRPERELADLREHLAEGHETPGIRVRQLAQEDGVQNAEHRRVHADPQGQREHGDGGEYGVAAEGSEREAQVLGDRLQPGRAHHADKTPAGHGKLALAQEFRPRPSGR